MTDKQLFYAAHLKAFPDSLENLNNIWDDFEQIRDQLDNFDLVMSAIIHAIIFSEEFAKAFWGTKMVHEVVDSGGSRMLLSTKLGHAMAYEEVWKYHLRVMVLEKYPLKYLERFL